MSEPTQEQKRGLYQKYVITKASGKPLNDDFYAIVLRIDGGRYLKACRAGVKAFADAVREENHILAEDLDRKLLELAVEDILMKTKNAPPDSFFNP